MSETFGAGEYVYRAVEGWAKWPEDWNLHDVAAVGIDRNDNVYAFHRGDHPMVVFDRDGNVLRTWGEGTFKRAHGVHMGADDTIYLTDDARPQDVAQLKMVLESLDEIDHVALMDRLRKRVGDKKVLALVKAFLNAGILGEDGIERHPGSGTPQGGILSPLLADLALTHLDDYFQARWAAHRNEWTRRRYRQRGGATYRLIRYADDFVIMVYGSRAQAEAQWEEVGDVLSEIGLRLAPEKTQVVHIDEGFDFLGFRIQRHRQWGSNRRYVYTYPSTKSVATARRKIKAITGKQTTNLPASVVFTKLNNATRGWTIYFRHGASKAAFGDLQKYLWDRTWIWLKKNLAQNRSNVCR